MIEYLDSVTLEIHHSAIHDITIHQMNKHSITIMHEGPHCDS